MNLFEAFGFQQVKTTYLIHTDIMTPNKLDEEEEEQQQVVICSGRKEQTSSTNQEDDENGKDQFKCHIGGSWKGEKTKPVDYGRDFAGWWRWRQGEEETNSWMGNDNVKADEDSCRLEQIFTKKRISA